MSNTKATHSFQFILLTVDDTIEMMSSSGSVSYSSCGSKGRDKSSDKEVAEEGESSASSSVVACCVIVPASDQLAQLDTLLCTIHRLLWSPDCIMLQQLSQLVLFWFLRFSRPFDSRSCHAPRISLDTTQAMSYHVKGFQCAFLTSNH